MLLQNMDPSKLCNGIKSQVIAFKNNIMETIIFFIFNPITGEYIFIFIHRAFQ